MDTHLGIERQSGAVKKVENSVACQHEVIQLSCYGGQGVGETERKNCRKPGSWKTKKELRIG